MNPPETPKPPLRAQLSTHILPTSATMVGVCLTALYISLLVPKNPLRIVIDELLALDSMAFLISALLSFLSMRARHRASRYELRAEWVFVGALFLLVLVALGLAFLIS